ncbi:hypothetical protein [Faucicola boevrei]|uniref:hypothetical protein n=1 Tax=Faucicola boevrei TaxID=346665 RepID=UPI00036C9C77|nr:hypothetical protein [Moraxella boevrei]
MSELIVTNEDNYVISFLDGAVICPSFSFGEDGYIERYLNLDFYKYSVLGSRIEFFNPRGENTAWIDISNRSFFGVWTVYDIPIQMKIFRQKFYEPYCSDESLREYLSNTRWRFRGKNGNIISDNLWLCQNGLVGGYTHHNEFSWGIVNGCLSFYTKDGVLSSTFNYKLLDGKHIRHFKGDFLLGANPTNHALDFLSDEGSYFLSELNTELTLSNISKTLFVVFNGNAHLYDGSKTGYWEFFSIPLMEGVDICRISEGSIVGWYIDKTKRVLSVLRSIVTNYHKVVFCGMSAGGFASIYFSEVLASEYKNINFYTFTFNPQTTLERLHRRKLVELFDMPRRPAVLNDFTFNNRDSEICSLNSFIDNCEITNVIHNIYYDCGNPCEQYYIDCLNFSNRLIINSYNFGLNHSDGIERIYRTYDAHREIEALLK